MSKQTCPYELYDTVDCAVTLDKNTYNNVDSLSVIIKDMKHSSQNEDEILQSKEIFESFCRGDNITKQDALSILPSRQDFAVVYRFLRAYEGFNHSVYDLQYRLNSDAISYGKLRVILECMNEMSLIEIYEGIYDTQIRLCDVQGKVNLEDSLIISKLKELSRLA